MPLSRPSTSVRRDFRVVVLAAALGLTAMLGVVSLMRGAPPTIDAPAGWTEIAWPLALDPWWPSKAFTCAASVCGAPVTLYLRAKIGFCNCKTGVADDAELERIGDFSLLAGRSAPEAEGRPIVIGTMQGRVRPYMMSALPAGGDASALLIGYNDRCDAVVATLVAATGKAEAAEQAALDFLASPQVVGWVERTLGL